MDASIRYEQDRPENIGSGMVASLNDFNGVQRPYCSMADLLAIGVVFSYRVCGGPLIPYRAGRVDATEAGVAGVPEPHQTIEEHIESFRKQGFTQSEMIALVACGHTVGGVRNADFPTAQIDPSVNVALFHGEQKYGRDIVTEFLDGTTPNPLVVSPNITMRSDQRVFSSDGNATMQSLTDPTHFDQTCSTLLERMINTVPWGVTLTDVIVPIENRVFDFRLFPSKDTEGELVLTVALRLLNPPAGVIVKLFWSDRRGPATCPASGCSVDSSSISAAGRGLKDLFGVTTARRYHFEGHINAASSIDKFWFELSDGTKIDNGGDGFAIEQDDFLFDPFRSFHIGVFPATISVTVAVRTDAGSASNIRMSTWDTNGAPPLYLPIVHKDLALLPSDTASMSGYTFYSVKSPEGEGVTELTLQGTVGGLDREIPSIESNEIQTFSSA
ncbi:heme peroxidase [Flagelloscypha sp. PMI_526]|nr:heme peroxidase [Flagelloscypha sp. PMI_526]